MSVIEHYGFWYYSYSIRDLLLLKSSGNRADWLSISVVWIACRLNEVASLSID